MKLQESEHKSKIKIKRHILSYPHRFCYPYILGSSYSMQVYLPLSKILLLKTCVKAALITVPIPRPLSQVRPTKVLVHNPSQCFLLKIKQQCNKSRKHTFINSRSPLSLSILSSPSPIPPSYIFHAPPSLHNPPFLLISHSNTHKDTAHISHASN